MISAVDVIRAKRDRERLTDEQIDWVVAAYTRGDVAEEQNACHAGRLARSSQLEPHRASNSGTRSRWGTRSIRSNRAVSGTPPMRQEASTKKPAPKKAPPPTNKR